MASRWEHPRDRSSEEIEQLERKRRDSRSWGLGSDVVDDTVDALDFVRDTGRDALEDLRGEDEPDALVFASLAVTTSASLCSGSLALALSLSLPLCLLPPLLLPISVSAPLSSSPSLVYGGLMVLLHYPSSTPPLKLPHPSLTPHLHPHLLLLLHLRTPKITKRIDIPISSHEILRTDRP